MKRLSRLYGILILPALALSMASSRAGESVFQEDVNGYKGTFDTEIVGGQPDAEGSKTSSLNPDGSDRGGVVQVLIRFDSIFGTGPNQIPPGQSVFFATLTLSITNPGNPLNLHRMLVPWADTVTWNQISDPLDLLGAAADGKIAAIESDVLFAAPAVTTVIDLPPSTIQAWLDGTAKNYGWVMIPTGTDGVDFDSSEAPNLAVRPILKVVWGTPGLPFLQGSTPSAQGISFRVKDGDGPGATQVNPSSIRLTVDGATVTPDISKDGEFTSVTYTAPRLLVSGSSHSYSFSFADTGSSPKTQTEAKSFTVPTFVTIRGSSKVADSAVNKSNSGFIVTIHQSDAARPGGNNLPDPVTQARGELIDAITGGPRENLVDTFYPGEESKWVPNASFTVPRIFQEDGVINYNQDSRNDPTATQGNFGPDKPIPGIPGITASTDNIAAEIRTFIELKAGFHRMAVNSDDGFVLSSSLNPRDALAAQLGLFNGGRGAADSFFDFAVEESGIYPFTLYWWEGGGGANVEWFTVDLNSGEKVLVNDTSNPNAVKAYRSGPSAPPYASSANPSPGRTGLSTDTNIEIVLQDAAQQVQTSSVKLSVNGQSVTPQVRKAGGTTTISYDPSAEFAPGSIVEVKLEFADSASPPNAVTQEYSFEILPRLLASGSVDVRVASGSDDAEEHLTESNAIDLTSSDLELGDEGGGGDTQAIGIRFQNVRIPAGSTISSATIQFTVDEADDEPTSLLIYGELSADPAAYGSDAGNITSRKKTTAFVEWNNIPEWNAASIGSAGPDQLTPDLSAIVQEIIGQPGWRANNAMAFIILPNPGGERTAEAFEGSAATAPLLHIDYTGGGGGGDASISIARSAAGVTITFGGTLQSSDSVTGPFTDVAGATSPAAIPFSGTAKFFRAR